MSAGLELVERLAKVKERTARRDVAEAVTRLAYAQEQAEHIVSDLEHGREQLSQVQRHGIDAADVAARYRHLSALEQRLSEAVGRCAELDGEVTTRQMDWRVARKEHQGVANIVARRAEHAAAERDKRSQQELDDLRRRPIGGVTGQEHAHG